MCMCVLPAYISVYHVHSRYSKRPEDGVGIARTRVTDGFEPPCGFWEWNPVLLTKEPIPLTAEPVLQPSLSSHLSSFLKSDGMGGFNCSVFN